MNLLNYFIEANIGLVIFLGAYVMLLRNETDFKLTRLFLLGGIFFSLTFPLLHIQYSANVLPTLGNVLAPYLLPNIIIVGDGIGSIQSGTSTGSTGWNYLQGIYIIGMIFFLLQFIVRMTRLLKMLAGADPVNIGKLKVVEVNSSSTTFSFFNFIVLGKADTLCLHEKRKIIEHETIHVKQRHSFDILLLNVIGIFFWFNPFLKSYKKIFVQLHEFEADARAVENDDVNEYCNLLARVALESAGLKLANHFNNSLTLKRIEMMRTIKRKIKPWKIAMITAVIPLTFFIVSCQDQVAHEATDIMKSSSLPDNIPEEVRQKYEALVEANPTKKFVILETDKNLVPKFEGMTKKFESLDQRRIGHVEIITPKAESANAVRTFAIVEYDESINLHDQVAGGDVLTIVDEPATPPGGIGDFYRHIMTKLTYPLQARQMGIEGNVFVEFVVNGDGSVSDIKVMKGIGAGCDEAAIVAVKTSPKWNPAKHDGVVVKQRLVMPVTFKLEGSLSKDQSKAPSGALDETVVVGRP